ncbi:SusC/RagA family TonB-linked outer membrane protein [Sphingobacterium sp. SYP-B4668]|uniref:SusC/RagA family TonB-linked outer membrane protein n=1 Tax=Sphingobacterium sp. SYP-B4668 TaxID=2996035 RepID=UPI0022DD6A0F|nr:SusC/RagA family TonB-linked outer membrane protein [Sphingobacterium sp. SYP-B4668]
MMNFNRGGSGLSDQEYREALFDPIIKAFHLYFRIKLMVYIVLLMALAMVSNGFNFLAKVLKGIQAILTLACIVSMFNVSAQELSGNQGAATGHVQQPRVVLRGEVRSAVDGRPIEGVSIRIGKHHSSSDKEGRFTIALPQRQGGLEVRHLGYQAQKVGYGPTSSYITIRLIPAENTIQEVEVVSTGYQKIPKERATGSFEFIGTDQLSRSLGKDLLSRLDGISSGIRFDKRLSFLKESAVDQITIRGLSTLRGDFRPLVVLDNYPFEGDLNSINPNDVESVTILKDAAAASIWGTKAASGVIVITTKAGRFDQQRQLTVNMNTRIGSKPDLYYLNEMSSDQFIDMETMLFDKGYYNYSISNPTTTLSPVVELLDRAQKGEISREVALARIDILRGQDVRKDYLKYVYRPSVHQQYFGNISGGERNSNYSLSMGYDRNLNELVTSRYNRLTTKSAVSFRPFERLEITANVHLARGNNINSGQPIGYGSLYSGGGKKHYPYLRLVDDQGVPVDVGTVTYRKAFTDTIASGRLLDWNYNPLGEMDDSELKTTVNSINFMFQAKYRVLEGVHVEGAYQQEREFGITENWHGIGAYSTRNLINLYSDWDDTKVVRNIPIGDMLTRTVAEKDARTFRGMLHIDRSVREGTHRFNAIIGAENRELLSKSASSMLYGYDRENLSFQNVDHKTIFPLVKGRLGAQQIPSSITLVNHLNRFVSVFANGSYTYDDRIVLSASFRKDASNIFGATSNKRWQPLWSSGIAWNVSKERYYGLSFLPHLKIRLTYGYNGKVNSDVPAVATIYHQGNDYVTGLPYAVMNNPPNPNFRWERVGIFNAAVDFATADNRIGGSIDFFRKRGVDIISEAPLDPTTGFDFISMNTASMLGKGIDVQINTLNIKKSGFTWGSTLLFNYNRNIVTKYDYQHSSAYTYTQAVKTINPVEGKDLYALYAYRFAGLDPENGDPVGFLDNEKSTDYYGILFGNMDAIKYIGPTVPIYAGSLQNSFTYKGINVSFLVKYNFGSYMHIPSMEYNSFGSYWVGNADYGRRWQQPGDEHITDVPSFSYPLDYARDEFYTRSEALVYRADQIRIKDLNINYSPKIKSGTIKNIRIYGNIDNLGIILWRKNKKGIDPEVEENIPFPRIYSFGISTTF